MNKKHCQGCHSNIYNHGHLGVKECWNLKDAKLKTRFRIHMDAITNVRANYKKERLPNCYHTAGYSSPSRSTIVDEIPSYAR